MDPAFYSQERFFAVFGAFALMAMISLAFGVYLVRRARD
jgi:ABC-type multidrug transport system permease subunit